MVPAILVVVKSHRLPIQPLGQRLSAITAHLYHLLLPSDHAVVHHVDSTDVANSPSVAMVAAMDPHVMVVASRRLVDTVDVALPILVDMVALPLSVATTLVLVVRGSHGLRVAAR